MSKLCNVSWTEDHYYEFEFEVEDDFDPTDESAIESLITNMDSVEMDVALDGLTRDIHFDDVKVTEDEDDDRLSDYNRR